MHWSLRLVLAVLLLAAAAIHSLETSAHFEEDAIYGWFFLAMGLTQSAAAIAIIIRPGRRILMITAAGSLAIIAVWAITRTAGIPLGAEAGTVEAVGRPDLMASALELSTAALAFWAVRLRRPIRLPIFAAPLSMLVALTAIVLAATGGREACEHFDSQYGPLAAIDGHSVLPRDTPEAQVGLGKEKSLLAGFVINCGSDDVLVRRVEVLTQTGEAVRIEALDVFPEHHQQEEDDPHHALPGDPVAVAPTEDHPEMAVFARARGVEEGTHFLNGLRISYLYKGRAMTQVFATALAIRVEAAG